MPAAAAEQRAGRVALVTGGACRLGRAIAERLAADGWAVAIHCRRSLAEAEALAASLPRACVLCADLANPTEAEDLVSRAVEALGRLDLVVNNAAVYRRAPLAESDATLLDEAWRVNVRAPLLLMRAFARWRAASVAPGATPGHVVNLLDARIASVRPNQTAYWLSKRALADATRAAALELAPGILVNAVAPGSALRPEPATAPDPAGSAPLGHHPGPTAVADAVAWLAHARDLTGQILHIDGGLHLAGGTDS